MDKKDTIAAIATGLTDSGIGIVRISGENAVETGDKIFRLPSGKRILKNAVSRMLYYGYAHDPESGEITDEVMAVVMKAPRSFTGEDTVEIQCHGGALVMRRILESALKCGARPAEPGEFSKRAFLNGRMDLAKAEAVMDLIQSRNEYALASSVSQLKGVLSDKIKKLRAEIIREIAFIESALDDPEHFSLTDYPEELSGKLNGLSKEIERLIATTENGRLIREGIRTVIVGKPNVGKSSLLNRLIGEERAIVTDVAGTTRDVLTECVRLGDISLNLTDTAGIRDTEDTVEKIGVERAKKYAEEADLIIYVTDVSEKLNKNDKNIISLIGDKKLIVLLNKSDLENVTAKEDIINLFRENDYFPEKGPGKFTILRTSAKDGEGMEELEKTIKEMFFQGEIKSNSEIIITNVRHKNELQETLNSLILVQQSIRDGMPEDFYSIDLMNAYASLGRIIGEQVEDDLVEEIFSKFCMGK